ncbi:MAG: UDP-N-acetylglucosamine 2-epimerase, partial [Anaerosomatales bacterium]|nr:UDP-N-acetylglucosamine 2-epimerase [Anaerosomatales bacterium]
MKNPVIHFIAGARPNFMKLAPIIKAVDENMEEIEYRIVHTGQHYDANMSDIFFRELGIPEPDYNLEVGSGSHAEQTARVMVAYEKVLLKDRPDLVVVVGDVNSTIACSLTAKKLGVSVAHVEAGLRSFDMTMPEEINRILTDRISDLLFVTEESGIRNLKNEGVADEKVHFVGNVMIDTLL